MSKFFGYPEFDANGEEILCTYDNEYSEMLMDVRVYRMAAGEKRTFCREGEEIAVLLLSGKIVFGWDDQAETVSRKDVFTEGPYAVHVCTGKQVTVEAVEATEILVQCTKNETAFAGKLYRPEDAP
ncbi:MAG: 5-deoxy-glucuronate isomerase, partial [Ruminococcaceae bacterium]|nr:5-deoxy-glucuronate isomerase [Oscillospiraceae bacterium]